MLLKTTKKRVIFIIYAGDLVYQSMLFTISFSTHTKKWLHRDFFITNESCFTIDEVGNSSNDLHACGAFLYYMYSVRQYLNKKYAAKWFGRTRDVPVKR